MEKFNIKEKFLELTSKTITYGSEDELKSFLPDDIKQDVVGNYYYRIGKSKSLFTAHLDDASWSSGDKINHIIEDEFIKTDGSTILGADDRSGVVILLYMIHNKVPGTYYFFVGKRN